MRPKVNIIVDTNLIFYKFAYVNAYKTNNYLSKQSHRSQFIKDVTRSIQTTVNLYSGYIDRVIFVADCNTKSWRKDIPVEEDFYKTTRKKDYPFDIGIFKNLLNNYIRMLREFGVYAYMFDRMEGDDLLFLISSILYHNGLSSVILTSDEDMRQLIKFDDGKFITVFDYDYEKKYNYVDREIQYMKAQEDDEYDGVFNIGSSGNVSRNNFNHILDIVYRDYRIVSPSEILFKKILAGDTSDNVPSSYIYPKGQAEKLTNFTEKRAIDLMVKYSPDKGFVDKLRTNTEFRLGLAEDMINEVKTKAQKTQPNDPELVRKVGDNLLRNTKFIYLHHSSYSEEQDLYNTVKQKIGKDLSNKEFLMNHTRIFADGWPDDLLAGTDFDTRDDEMTMDFRNI